MREGGVRVRYLRGNLWRGACVQVIVFNTLKVQSPRDCGTSRWSTSSATAHIKQQAMNAVESAGGMQLSIGTRRSCSAR